MGTPVLKDTWYSWNQDQNLSRRTTYIYVSSNVADRILYDITCGVFSRYEKICVLYVREKLTNYINTGGLLYPYSPEVVHTWNQLSSAAAVYVGITFVYIYAYTSQAYILSFCLDRISFFPPAACLSPHIMPQSARGVLKARAYIPGEVFIFFFGT